jgi:pyrroloquinoline quinone biosynthesis protein D
MDEQRPRQGEEIFFRQIEDEGILYQPQENRVHSLNRTALLIWELCDGEHTVEDIAEKVRTVFRVSRKRALEDVEATLKQLKELGLLDS